MRNSNFVQLFRRFVFQDKTSRVCDALHDLIRTQIKYKFSVLKILLSIPSGLDWCPHVFIEHATWYRLINRTPGGIVEWLRNMIIFKQNCARRAHLAHDLATNSHPALKKNMSGLRVDRSWADLRSFSCVCTEPPTSVPNCFLDAINSILRFAATWIGIVRFDP